MKNLFGIISIVLLVASFGCKSDTSSSSEQTDPNAAEEGGQIFKGVAAFYDVDPGLSVIKWEGSKPTGTHDGTVQVVSGKLAVAQDKLVGGDMSVDMSSITVLDLEGDYKGKLEGHLKSGDFFNVDSFPFADFKFVQIQPQEEENGINYNVRGNLRIKNTSNSVNIPANVVITEEEIRVVTPSFTINRTEWDLKYNSGILGTVKDKLIYDDIKLSIEMVAKRRGN